MVLQCGPLSKKTSLYILFSIQGTILAIFRRSVTTNICDFLNQSTSEKESSVKTNCTYSLFCR